MKKSSFQGDRPAPGTVEEDLVLGKKNFLKLNPARSYGKRRNELRDFKFSIIRTGH